MYKISFSIQLAFAITINNSQDQSFEKVGLLIKDENALFRTGNYMSLCLDEDLSQTL